MIEIETLLALIWIHFIADFLFQTDKMALNKSKDINILLLHSFVYSIPFILFGIKFVFIMFITHFFIDMLSSTITSYYHETNNRRRFFLTIGFDQAIHLSVIIMTAKYLFGK